MKSAHSRGNTEARVYLSRIVPNLSQVVPVAYTTVENQARFLDINIQIQSLTLIS